MFWDDCGLDRDLMTLLVDLVLDVSETDQRAMACYVLRYCIERCICVSAGDCPHPTVHAAVSNRNKLTLEPIDLDLVCCPRKNHFIKGLNTCGVFLAFVEGHSILHQCRKLPVLPSRVDLMLRIPCSQTLLM